MRGTARAVLAAIFVPMGLAAASFAAAQAKPLQVQESNLDGYTAELTEVAQSDGVLTVKIRFRNTGANKTRLRLVGNERDVDKFYVVAGSTKLLPLRDSEHVPLMAGGGTLEPEVSPGASYVFWAKFPAPPAGTKKVAIHTSQTPPFDNVALVEAK
jgi:hypothetical protein